jgi:hypothetical protein
MVGGRWRFEIKTKVAWPQENAENTISDRLLVKNAEF